MGRGSNNDGQRETQPHRNDQREAGVIFLTSGLKDGIGTSFEQNLAVCTLDIVSPARWHLFDNLSFFLILSFCLRVTIFTPSKSTPYA